MSAKLFTGGTDIPGRGGGRGRQDVFPLAPSSSFPSCCPWQAQLVALLQLMILETTPLGPFSLQSFFPPACQPLQGHQG